MKTRLLLISLDFNYACGVSKHVFIYLKNFSLNPDYELYFIANKGDSLDRLFDLPDVKFSSIDIKKDHKNPFKLIKDFFQLLSYCKKNKIDIIHTHHRYSELISLLVSKITGAKTITTVHSLVSGLKNLSFRSDIIICVSNAVKKNLSDNYSHTKDKLTVLHNCIDDSFYEPREINTYEFRKSLGYTDSDKIILFVGRISRIKGVDTLINAFVKINLLNENVKLILLGHVEDIDISEATKGFEKQILVIPPIKDISEFYQASDLVVLPSRIDPFPYVMLEAGAMKKPFIGGNTGGISEFIEDGKNGILIEPGNSDQLTDKIIFLINNPDQAELLADALYQKVKKKCDCEKYFEQLNQILNQILD